MYGYIKIKKTYHKDTKEILKKLKCKPTFKFYIDFAANGIFIETRMMNSPDDNSGTYDNIRLKIKSNLVLNEIIIALNEAFGVVYYCRDGVECFTFQY